MPRLEACLVDAYDTIVTCDFTPLRHGVPALAGIPVAAWEQEYTLVSPMLNDGRLSKAQAFRQIMASCGGQATDDLIAELVRRDQELLLANARLYDDVIPFLTRLSDRGIKIAIVSNCTENTRAMLVATGVMLGTAVAQKHQHRNRRTIWHSERARSRSCFSSCIPTTMAKSLSKSL